MGFFSQSLSLPLQYFPLINWKLIHVPQASLYIILAYWKIVEKLAICVSVEGEQCDTISSGLCQQWSLNTKWFTYLQRNLALFRRNNNWVGTVNFVIQQSKDVKLWQMSSLGDSLVKKIFIRSFSRQELQQMAACVTRATGTTMKVQKRATRFIVGKGQELRNRLIKLNYSR